jgi:proteic killer suppression protein
MPIKSFRHRGLKRLYERGDESQVNQQHKQRIKNILTVLDAAESIGDLDIALWRLHSLKSGLANFWALKVSANWRIVFRFEGGNAFDVDLIDYH